MFSTKFNDTLASLGLLILRFVSGGMMLTHGYQKLMKFAELKSGFPDPLGVGHDISLYLTLFAELVCAALLLIGLFTRLALLPLLVTMIVAFFIIHAKDPLGDKELALFYLTAYTTLFFTGAGKYSMDKVVFKK